MSGPGASGSAPGPLLAALKAQAPPQNPATPNERINPQQTGLEHLKAASISLQRSKEFIEDPMMARGIDAMIGAINKALLQFDGTAVLSALQESLGVGMSPPNPSPGAPGMGAPSPMAAAGGAGQAATPPAAPPALGQPGAA